MVFSSNVFLFFFLPTVLVLYYLCPRNQRNLMLLIISLIFYAWGEPVYVLLMIGVILLDYVSGRILFSQQLKGKSRKLFLLFSLVLNLALLVFYKYANFLIHTVNLFLPEKGKVLELEIALPIGISFYLFQSMGYIIDVYRGEVECQKNLITFGTYVSLFPQLIAGPIVRYKDIAKQLEARTETAALFSTGVQLFIIGLAKKILLANKMGELYKALQGSGGTLAGWICMFAYSFQIYFDFSGYSDMAIGLGKMFGIELLHNFRYPYCSKSISDFWRKWHISLGNWFREYVYIPLGGNRKGRIRCCLNLVIVWALTGLWHGASWNFVLWGLYYACLLIAEKFFLLKRIERLPNLVRIILTFLIISFGWVIFSHTDICELGLFLRKLFSPAAEDSHSRNLIFAYLPLLAITMTGSTPLPARLFHLLDGKKIQPYIQIGYLGFLLILCVAYLAKQSYNPFIYFRF